MFLFVSRQIATRPAGGGAPDHSVVAFETQTAKPPQPRRGGCDAAAAPAAAWNPSDSGSDNERGFQGSRFAKTLIAA